MAVVTDEDLDFEVSRLRKIIDRLLICGNHIALYRTEQWPAYQAGGRPRWQQCDEARKILGSGQEYDLWCCWSGMMQERDTYENMT